MMSSMAAFKKRVVAVAATALCLVASTPEARATAIFDASASVLLTILEISNPIGVQIFWDGAFTDELTDDLGTGSSVSASALVNVNGNDPDNLGVGDSIESLAAVDGEVSSPPGQDAVALGATDTGLGILSTSSEMEFVRFGMEFSFAALTSADNLASEFAFGGVDMFVASSTQTFLDIFQITDTLTDPDPVSGGGMFEFTLMLGPGFDDFLLVRADAFGDATSRAAVPEPTSLLFLFLGSAIAAATANKRLRKV